MGRGGRGEIVRAVADDGATRGKRIDLEVLHGIGGRNRNVIGIDIRKGGRGDVDGIGGSQFSVETRDEHTIGCNGFLIGTEEIGIVARGIVIRPNDQRSTVDGDYSTG